MLGLEQNISGEWSPWNATGDERKDDVLITADRSRQTISWTNFTRREVVKGKLDENNLTLHS